MGSFMACESRDRRRLSGGCWMAALVACSAGCAPELDYPPLVAEEWPFRFYSDLALPSCTVEAAVAHHALWEERLGTSLAANEFVDVVIHDSDYVTTFCEGGSGGPRLANACAFDRTVVSPYPFYPHELIHAYANEHGHSLMVLSEGLATLGDCRGPPSTVLFHPSIDLREIAESADMRALSGDDLLVAYSNASFFVGFLVERLGWASFMELYAALDRDASRSRIDAEFVRSTGSSYDALVTEWELSAPKSGLDLCTLSRAAASPLPLGETIEAGCVSPYLTGVVYEWMEPPVAELGLSGSLSFGSSSRLTMRWGRDHGLSAQLVDEDASKASSLGFHQGAFGAYDASSLYLWDAPPGEYRLDVWDGPYSEAEIRTRPTYELTATSLGSGACSLPAIDITAHRTVGLSDFAPDEVRPGGDPRVLAFRVTEPRTLWSWSLGPGATYLWCVDACDTSPPCTPFEEDPPGVLAPNIDLVPGEIYRVVATRGANTGELWMRLHLQ